MTERTPYQRRFAEAVDKLIAALEEERDRLRELLGVVERTDKPPESHWRWRNASTKSARLRQVLRRRLGIRDE